MSKLQSAIDAVLKDIQNIKKDGPKHPPTRPSSPVALWMSQEYKDKFNALQVQTNKEFGKLIKETVIACIDSVYKD